MPAPRSNVQIRFDPESVDSHDALRDAAAREWTSTTTLSPIGRTVLALFSLALIAFACGAAALSVDAKFLYRDDVHVTANPAVQHWAGLIHIWRHPLQMPSFSPMGYTAYLVEARAFGPKVDGYRVVSLLLHAACAMLIWTLLRRLEFAGAWLAAALFAANPVQVDAIAWIAQQRIVLATFFYLAAVIVHCRFTGLNPAPPDDPERAADFNPFRLPSSRPILFGLAIILLAASALSHAMIAASWPIAVVLITWWDRGSVSRRDFIPLGVFIIVAIAAVVADVNVTVVRQSIRGPEFPTILQRIELVGLTLPTHALHAIAPWPGTLSFSYLKWSLDSVAYLVPAVLVVGALAALWFARRRIGRGPFAAASLYAVALLPFSGLVNFDGMRQSDIADHFQYLALAVPMLVVAGAIWQAFQRISPEGMSPIVVRFRAAAAGVLVLLLLAGSIVRAADYSDQRTLWTRVADRYPDSAPAQNMLGHYALDVDGKPNVALAHFLRALAVDPSSAETHGYLARTYEQQGEWDKALGEYFQTLRLRPDDLDMHMLLANAHKKRGDPTSAMREYQTVVERSTDRPAMAARAFNEIALLQADRGARDEAIETFRRAITLDPRFTMPRVNLASQLFALNRIQEAGDELNAVIAIDPQNFGAFENGGVIVMSLAQRASTPTERAQLYQLAERLFKGAARVRENEPAAWSNLGFVLVKQAHARPRDRAIVYLNEAAVCYRTVQRLNPNDRAAAQNLKFVEQERDRATSLTPGGTYELPPEVR